MPASRAGSAAASQARTTSARKPDPELGFLGQDLVAAIAVDAPIADAHTSTDGRGSSTAAVRARRTVVSTRDVEDLAPAAHSVQRCPIVRAAEVDDRVDAVERARRRACPRQDPSGISSGPATRAERAVRRRARLPEAPEASGRSDEPGRAADDDLSRRRLWHRGRAASVQGASLRLRRGAERHARARLAFATACARRFRSRRARSSSASRSAFSRTRLGLRRVPLPIVMSATTFAGAAQFACDLRARRRRNGDRGDLSPPSS